MGLLDELRSAALAYPPTVSARVRIIPVGSVINAGENFSFEVTVTNGTLTPYSVYGTQPTGGRVAVRIINLRFHIGIAQLSHPGYHGYPVYSFNPAAKVIVPPTTIGTSHAYGSGAVIPPGTEVDEYYLIPANPDLGALDPYEADALPALQGRALQRGSFSVEAGVQADFDLNYLLPPGWSSSRGRSSRTIES